MARQYDIQTPDGKTITVEGPEDATDDELIAFAQTQIAASGSAKYAKGPVEVKKPQAAISPTPVAGKMSPGATKLKEAQDKYGAPGGISALLMNGASFGLSDEASGAVNALGNVLTSPFTGDFSPRQAYVDGRDVERGRIADALGKYPVAGNLALLLGGFAGANPGAAIAAAPTALAAIRSGAVTGAIGGAIGGWGSGNGTEESAVGGVLGGVGGGVLGAGVPVAVNGLARSVGGIGRLVGRDPGVARQVVGQALANDANTGAQAGAIMDRAHTLGVPMMLADTGDNARGLLASVGRQPGASRSIVLDAVGQRQAGQGERIRGAIERGLGPITNGFDQSDALMQGARARAGPLYDEAYAQPGVMSDELQSLLQTPTGRAALSRAHRIAADERRDPSAMGLLMDADGNVTLNPVPSREIGGVDAARAELDAAQDQYRSVRGSAGGGTVESARQRVESAREGLRNAQQTLAGAPQEGSPVETPAFTVQTLDYVKRGIDDVLNEKKNAFGRLQLDEAGRAIEGVRRQFVSEVDRLHPGPYQEARSVYAGPAAAREALETGAEALNKSPQEISRQIGYYGDNEREMFAQGYRNQLANSIDRRVDDADKARAILGTPAKRDALSEVFPGEGLAQFTETLGAEQAGNQTFRSVTGGSQTAERLAYDAQTGDPGLAETVVDATLRGSKDGLWSTIVNGLQSAREVSRYGVGEAGNRVRQSVASLLTETDPAELSRIMAEANAEVIARQARAAQITAGGSVVGGQLGRGIAVAGGNTNGR
jgi:hypothetical protein